jgi:hypothetical protein
MVLFNTSYTDVSYFTNQDDNNCKLNDIPQCNKANNRNASAIYCVDVQEPGGIHLTSVEVRTDCMME